MRTVWAGLLVCGFLSAMNALAQAFEVIPAVVDVEAGGGSSQVLVRGAGAERIQQFHILAGGKKTSYLLARGTGQAAGQVTVVIHARQDTPRHPSYTLAAAGQSLPLKIRVVNPGEAKNTGRPAAATQDLRQVVAQAETSQIVVTSDQAPQVLRTVPSPLMVAPDGEGKIVQLMGRRLETIDDVRVRKADQPPRYRGKQGKLPFTYESNRLLVELMASRDTARGERYMLDLMVGKFKAFSVSFTIGEPTPASHSTSGPIQHDPLVIELPDSASQHPSAE
ncbi:MAG: hypothetical protein AAF649_12245 [Verrucomicrobiota bacterium]